MYAQTVRILSPAKGFTMLSATPYIAMILFSLAPTESRSISNEPNPTITEGVHSRLKRMVIQRKRTSLDECNSAKTEYKNLTAMVKKMNLRDNIIKLGDLIHNQVNGFSLFFKKEKDLSGLLDYYISYIGQFYKNTMQLISSFYKMSFYSFISFIKLFVFVYIGIMYTFANTLNEPDDVRKNL